MAGLEDERQGRVQTEGRNSRLEEDLLRMRGN